MGAYYSEFDPFKAAWLRELIKRNLIAPGVVDERSIADVRADELMGYTQWHLFAGIGIWSYAARLGVHQSVSRSPRLVHDQQPQTRLRPPL